jgi:hypothetical protein
MKVSDSVNDMIPICTSSAPACFRHISSEFHSWMCDNQYSLSFFRFCYIVQLLFNLIALSIPISAFELIKNSKRKKRD